MMVFPRTYFDDSKLLFAYLPYHGCFFSVTLSVTCPVADLLGHDVGFLTLGTKLDPLLAPPLFLLVDLRWIPPFKNPRSAPVAVGRRFPPGTPVSSTRKLISSSSFHRLDMTLAVAEALNPNNKICYLVS